MKNNLFDLYYKNLFPHDLIINYLYNIEIGLDNREYAINYLNNNYFTRYISITNNNDYINKIANKNVSRIEIGPIYETNINLRLFDKNNLKPYGKELVLDLDISDYKDVLNCTCPNENIICKNCILLFKYNIKIINLILIDNYKINQFFWLFSGKKGFHCIIYDELIFTKNEKFREKFIQIFENYRTIKLINDIDYIKDKFLFKKNVKRKIKKYYDILNSRDIIKSKNLNNNNNNKIIYKKKLFFIIPKIDKMVSIKLNHLSKIAYSIHPSTLIISTIIDHRNIKNFDIKVDILYLNFITELTFKHSNHYKYLKKTIFLKYHFFCLKCFKNDFKNNNYTKIISELIIFKKEEIILHLNLKHNEYKLNVSNINKYNLNYFMDATNLNFKSILFCEIYKKYKNKISNN